MERMSLDVNKMTKDQLRQHILMLAMQLTQLEEENEKLKKYYDRDKEELIESCYGLAKENEKLKSDYDRLDKVASENVRTLDELNAEIIELKEYRSIEIKTCNRYREKCEKMKKLFEEAEELLLIENLSSQHYWSRKEVINKIKEKLEELDL